jgi:choline dehydrogenase-like flavoprotein
VFPTCGFAPPTLTIVALALRVADRVADDLATDTRSDGAPATADRSQRQVRPG